MGWPLGGARRERRRLVRDALATGQSQGTRAPTPPAEAERLAREAVAIGEGTDALNEQGEAYADLAEVLLLGGKADEAIAALEQALERYERKENLAMAQRMRDRLAETAAQTAGAKIRT